MKLQLAFDMADIEQAVIIARQVADEVDRLEIGSLLLAVYGRSAITRFREEFPQKILLADTKIVDRGRDASMIAFQAGADWVTVLAGTSKSVIHAVTSIARELGKRTMLDLIDASSPGQSALEAETLGVDALLFHRPMHEAGDDGNIFEQWDMVRGNTTLPVFVALPQNMQQAPQYLALKPSGAVIGKVITDNPQPLEAIRALKALMNGAVYLSE